MLVLHPCRKLCRSLSGHERKFSGVCGEEFSAQARRERRAYPGSGSVRSEQRRLGRKEPPPGGLRRIWPGASLLVGHSPTGGGCSLLAPRPRPNWAQETSSYLRPGPLRVRAKTSTGREAYFEQNDAHPLPAPQPSRQAGDPLPSDGRGNSQTGRWQLPK